jgi:hypothetical protein
VLHQPRLFFVCGFIGECQPLATVVTEWDAPKVISDMQAPDGTHTRSRHFAELRDDVIDSVIDASLSL